MEKFFRKNKFLILILILGLGLALRIININVMPPGLQVDEGVAIYNAYSIAETGTDVFGDKYPVHFTGFGWGENSVLIYSLVLIIKLFGLNYIWIFRLVIVFFSLLLILFTYLLAKELFNYKIGLLAAFLLAISPWSLILSRLLFNVSILPFLFVAGLYFIFRGLKTNKYYHFILAAVLFSLSLYTYALSFLWLPLLFLIIVFVYNKQIRSLKISNIILFAVVFLILSLPIILFYLKNQLGLFENFNKLMLVSLPDLLRTRFDDVGILNLPIYLIPLELFKNYLLHFSPVFWFWQNSLIKQPGFAGLMYLMQAPLLFLGIIICLKKYLKLNYKFILFWLIFAAVPVAFTIENLPHALRYVNALPVFEILMSLAIVWGFSHLKKRHVVIFLVLIIINVFGFLSFYFIFYPQIIFNEYHGADFEITKTINDLDDEYQKIYILDLPRTHNLSFYNYLIYNDKDTQIIKLKISQLQEAQIAIGKLNFVKCSQICSFEKDPDILYLMPVNVRNASVFLENKEIIKEFKNLKGETQIVLFKFNQDLLLQEN